ncbi:MAG: FecR family protein [Tannerellaceae bacterium]|jgi:ferric-dicitrate binding protein FerR (iron transport regulator)|nr:FecR family protein [Tannerellaceae bacterium]
MDDKLLQLYFEGRTTNEQSRLITEWLDANEANMKYYQQLCRLYDINFWYEVPEVITKPFQKKIKRKHIWQKAIEIAAIFILGFALHYCIRLSFVDTEEDIAMQTIYVPPGQNAQLTLADGSQVWLNAGSTLNFPTRFTKGKRKVSLNGEGFFEVKANKDKPFIVSTPNYDIKALGTSFNVRAYRQSKDFETALLTGKVEITDYATNQVFSLAPDNQAILTNNKLSVVPIQHIDYFLWRKGILYFDEPLIEVLKKLELYFDMNIQINNKFVVQNKQHSTAKFRTRDGLYHILDVLQLTHHFSYKKDEEKNLIIIN